MFFWREKVCVPYEVSLMIYFLASPIKSRCLSAIPEDFVVAVTSFMEITCGVWCVYATAQVSQTMTPIFFAGVELPPPGCSFPQKTPFLINETTVSKGRSRSAPRMRRQVPPEISAKDREECTMFIEGRPEQGRNRTQKQTAYKRGACVLQSNIFSKSTLAFSSRTLPLLTIK